MPPTADATTIAHARPWQNNRNVLDVNDDGFVSPLDALLVINYLNSIGPEALAAPTVDRQPGPFVDVSGDGFVSPLDALYVINELNRLSTTVNADNQSAPVVASAAVSHASKSASDLRLLAAAIDRIWAADDHDDDDVLEKVVPKF